MKMRFKNVMDHYGVTQQMLAERLNINRVPVSRLLSEKNDLRLSTIWKIANAIGYPVGELFTGTTNEDDFVALIKKGNSAYSASTISEAFEILKHINSQLKITNNENIERFLQNER